MNTPLAKPHETPRVIQMRVIPVAGRDGMLLNLSGAHAPFFTRNIVIVTDSAGHTGLGEVPGGEKSVKPWKTRVPWSRVNRSVSCKPS